MFIDSLEHAAIINTMKQKNGRLRKMTRITKLMETYILKV